VTDWSGFAAVATGVSAVATAVSAGIIAWQATETKRAAVAAERALNLGGRSLRVSQELAAEAVKARLDARGPRLIVFTTPTENEVARGRSSTGTGAGDPWPMEREFRRSEDDYQKIALGTQIDIVNEGDVSVEVWIDGATQVLRPEGPSVRNESGRFIVPLGQGGRCEFRVDALRPLTDWIELWDERGKGGAPSPAARATVICSDSFDEGVIDRWQIEVVAYPVEPKPNDLAAWLLRKRGGSPPLVTSFVYPQKRTYYLSKRSTHVLEVNGDLEGHAVEARPRRWWLTARDRALSFLRSGDNRARNATGSDDQRRQEF
jgi:hypothetical protein